MKAKKILTGVLALAMIASLSACGGGGSAATPAPETSAPETTAPETVSYTHLTLPTNSLV